MNSGKTDLALELFLGQTKGVHAEIGEALEEDDAGQPGELRGGPGGEAVHFVEFDGGGEEEFGAGVLGGGAEGEQGVVGNVEKDLAHGEVRGLGEQGRFSRGAGQVGIGGGRWRADGIFPKRPLDNEALLC